MRILLLCKRRYTAKDLIGDRFGRLAEIPRGLAAHGHEVRGMLLGYGNGRGEVVRWAGNGESGVLEWHSVSAGTVRPYGFACYARHALSFGREFRPDVVVASSDTLYVILGAWLARRLGVPFVADLYDDYESFASARIPGLVRIYRRAVRRADLAVCISEPLAEMVRGSYGRSGQTVVIENGIDPEIFRPLDRAACRRRFGLPLDVRIVGTVGALSESRNISVLYDAFAALADRQDVVLAVAGPRDRPVPGAERIFDLGELPWHEVPLFLNALDVGVVCNRDSSFGRYCFPQKAYEMIACGLPVCVADLGAMGRIFADYPRSLFKPDDAKSLAAVIGGQLDAPSRLDISVPTWKNLTERYCMQLVELATTDLTIRDM